MNKILVLFDSKSCNVAQMAGLVAEGARAVPDTEVRLWTAVHVHGRKDQHPMAKNIPRLTPSDFESQ